MEEYHKIQSVYLRDPDNKHKTFLMGQWARPEFEYLRDLNWVWTEKVDGTNIRINWSVLNGVRFGGRTENAQIPAFLFEHLQDTFPPDLMLSCFDGSATLYGEGYGAKIQKGGGNYRSDSGFILFDVSCGGVWLEHSNVEDIARKLSIPTTPILGSGSLEDAIDFTAAGFTSRCSETSQVAEGLVMRPRVELCNRQGHRIIAKVKHKDFQ